MTSDSALRAVALYQARLYVQAREQALAIGDDEAETRASLLSIIDNASSGRTGLVAEVVAGSGGGGLLIANVPLEVKLVEQDKDERPPTDQLRATKKSERDNPELLPYNRDPALNPAYDPNLTFFNVAGQTEAIQLLNTAIVQPYVYPDLFSGTGGSNVMLYGVGGVGKTTLAAAAANAMQAAGGDPYRSAEEIRAMDENEYLGPGWVQRYWPSGLVPKVIFYAVSQSDISSKWVGEAPRKVERWFELARETAPSILFFDEAEANLNPANEHNAATITAFKQESGGLGAGGNRRVYLILATNYPTQIESAILSRFPNAVEIKLPDLKAREQVLIESVSRQFKAVELANRLLPPGDRSNESERRARMWIEPLEAATIFQTLAKRTAPQPGAYWSARDLNSLVARVVATRRSKDVQGYVASCAQAGGGPTDCNLYGPGDYLVPCNPTDPGAVLASTLGPDEKARIKNGRLSLADFDYVLDGSELSPFRPTTTKDAIRSQLEFNRDNRGLVANPNDPLQQQVDTFVNGGIEPPIIGQFGPNTTVPSD